MCLNQETDSLPQAVNKLERPIPDISKELKALYPVISQYTLTNAVFVSLDSTPTDTVTLFTAKTNRLLFKREREKLTGWIKQRIGSDSVKLLNELND
jgi:hypothetical protein